MKKKTLRRITDAERPAVRWTDLLAENTFKALLATIKSFIGKSWFDAWELHDVCYLIRAARHAPPCKTCNGSGYQGIEGHPGCQGGCQDCAGTGVDLFSANMAHQPPNELQKGNL